MITRPPFVVMRMVLPGSMLMPLSQSVIKRDYSALDGEVKKLVSGYVKAYAMCFFPCPDIVFCASGAVIAKRNSPAVVFV